MTGSVLISDFAEPCCASVVIPHPWRPLARLKRRLELDPALQTRVDRLTRLLRTAATPRNQKSGQTPSLLPHEGEEVGIQAVHVGEHEPVGRALVHDEPASGNQLRRLSRG